MPRVKDGVPRFVAALPRRLFLALMFVGSAIITVSSIGYFDFSSLPPFVIEKLPVRFETLWMTSLRVHVAAACISLPLCLLLMTRPLQRRVSWHRWLGRIAGVLVLFALVPTGTILAFDAKGGGVVTAGFLVSGGIIAWSMARGVQAARRRDLVAHRRALAHVVAQMSVAVTSRAMLIGLDVVGVNPDLAYVAALWGPVLGSAAVAELASPSSPSSIALVTMVRSLPERIRRAFSHPPLPLRLRSVSRPALRVGRVGPVGRVGR
jgi:uncharacterized membrane protein YozB (DUF420 family)